MGKIHKFLAALLVSIPLVLTLVILVMLVSCDTKNTSTGKLNIVTTTGMIADVVINIAGDSANVSSLMGPGVDPHLYKATYGDVNKLTDADIIFYNGLHLEGKLQEIFKKLAKAKTVVAVSNDIDRNTLTKIPGSTESYDPHIWFDVQKWQQCVDYTSKIMQQKDLAHASYYKENTRKYLLKLDSLHQFARRKISEIPPSQRVLVTAHDAFGYFGKAYEIEVKGLQGISTLSEFGLKDVSELVHLIVSRKIKAVFVESSVPQKSIEAVVEGCKARGHQVKIGGNLYSDAMGNPGTPAGTYIGMVRANIETIVAALK
jgi:manganese/zinc/iron transport system substrate-binding protein